MKKRIIALLLCLSMLLPMFTGSVVANDEDYSANVGKYAMLAETGYGVQVGNFTDIATGNDAFLLYEEFEPGTIFQITDWYLDTATFALWYGVTIYSGGVVPEAQEYWPETPWILQDYVGEAAEGDSLVFLDTCDICGKPNCGGHESADSADICLNGEAVSEMTMPKYDKPTLSATTTLEGDISYRWQILANVGSEFWVNIYGENSRELTLSYGMVATLLDSSNQAWVRCVTSADGVEVVSDPLQITVEPHVAFVMEYELPVFMEPIEPMEEVTEPSEPAEETTEPTGESTEPTGETTEPTEESTEPTGETTEPTEESTEPTGETTEPTEESSEPAEETTEPTEETTGPSEAASEPTEEPSAPTVGPTVPEETVEAASEPVVEPLTQEAMRQLPLEERIPSSASAVNDELVNHDIVVAYIFDGTDTIAAPNYTATVGQGDPFKETITFPTVPGYEPYRYVNNSWVQEDTYTFAIDSVTEDVHMEVIYRPALVPYRVYVHLQNVEDSEYQSAIEDSDMAYTGSVNYEFDQENVKYPGFYQLPYEKPPIAADGSTVVQIYFDRYYYLMKFDQDGGYGAEPIYARYGTPLSVPTPTRAGYEFIGWDKNGDGKADALPATMPHENTSYKALWKEENTVKVTVVFWGENADDEAYSFLPDYTKEVYVKPGTSFTYSEDADLVCGYDEEHTHNASCGYNCGLEAHEHSIENSCYAQTCPLEEHTHSESCNTCNAETHNHTTDCYENVGDPENSPWRAPASPSEGQVYTVNFWGNSTSYIYIDGSWYRYTGKTADGETAPTTCGKTEQTHTHTEACIGCGKVEHSHSIENNCYDTTPTCGKEVHTHSDLCYNCGIREHSHTNDCHLDQNRPDASLWSFVKSDTVTVKADGTTVVNVYYDRKEFTLTFRASNSTVATITQKWGARIYEEFNKAPFNTTYNGRAWQCTETNKYSAALQTLDIMPKFNATFTLYNKSSNTLKTIYYYVQIPGTSVSENTWPNNTTNFTLLKTVQTYFNYATYDEEYHEMDGYKRYSESVSGFTGNDKRKDFSNNTLYLYYLCDSYDLTFNDGLDDIETKHPMYGQSLADYASFVPDPPDIYEPGSVEFDGWYQNPECTGEEYVLSEHTMPANDLLLYAKWKLASHTVQIFPSVEDAQNQTNQIGETQTILHGNMATEPEEPVNEPYQFVGWFYTLNGVEHAFDFDDMPVVRNLILYAKWSSNVLVDYTVRYFKKDTTESVAPDTTGSGLAGITKTFEAADAPDGWFPTVKSHNMPLVLDETQNVYTFYYVEQDAVPYTVRYVTMNDEGIYVDLSGLGIDGAPATKVVSDNRKAVVTENFVPVPGYLPDASRKTLVVSADGQENVITFIYTQDEVNAYYIVSDWLQNTDGTTWTQDIREEGSNKIGTQYTRNPITIPGFTYDADNLENQSTGILQKNEILKLNFYYTRDKYPYQIRYLEYGTEKQLADPETFDGDDSAYYGEAVNAEGQKIPNIDGYELHSVKGCTIAIETNTDALHNNVVKVYYVPVTGSLAITKHIDVINNNVPLPDGQQFEFRIGVPEGITGSYPVTIGEETNGYLVIDGFITVNLSDGETATIADLPQGPSEEKYQYTIEETHVPGFNSTFASAGPYTVSKDSVTEVSCTNQYPVGTLQIVKTVEKEYSGDAWAGGTFGFTVTSDALIQNNTGYMVSIDNQAATQYWVSDHTISLEGIEVTGTDLSTTITIANVPAGSYTVSEKETDALKAAYKTTANGNSDYAATVNVEASETPAKVEIVNTFKRTTGDLYVSKTIEIVEGSGAEIDPNAEFTFTVQMPEDMDERHFTTYTVTGHNPVNKENLINEVTVDNEGKCTFILRHNEHLTIEDLPVGSYVVTEAPASGYASSFPVPQQDGSVSETVTIATGEKTELKCVNTYPVHIGNLEISKTVRNDSGLAKELDDTFTFQVTFPVKGTNRDFPATLTKTDGNTEVLTLEPVESDDKVTLTVSLKDGESVLIEKLPEGECTVTEVNIPHGYTAETFNGSVTIAPDQTQTLAVTNVYKPPTLTIERQNAEAGQVFVYEVRDKDGEIITVTVTGNGSTVIHDLAPGEYTVTQKNDWSWRYGDEEQTIKLSKEDVKVTFSDVMQKDNWVDGNSALVPNRYQQTGG